MEQVKLIRKKKFALTVFNPKEEKIYIIYIVFIVDSRKNVYEYPNIPIIALIYVKIVITILDKYIIFFNIFISNLSF